MAGTIHQSDYRLACCRKRWRRRLNDDDDDDDGDYVDGMLMMVVMVTVMLIMLMDPTRKICSNVGSSRLTCFSLERRRRRRDGKKGRDGGQAGQAVATMSELMKKLRCLEDKVKLQQKDIDTLYDMCQTAHKRITLQDNRITELETTNVAVQEVAVQKTTTVEVMEPPKKRQRKKGPRTCRTTRSSR